MRSRLLLALVAGSVLSSCGARSALGTEHDPVDAAIDTGIDTGIDAGRDSARPDTSPPAACRANRDDGVFDVFIPEGEFVFPFVVGGVEPFGTHSCPRLFIRAGQTPTFEGVFMEIEVPFGFDDPLTPGIREGLMNVFDSGRFTEPLWSEVVQVDVRRADGIFDARLPSDEWRMTVVVSHHDATTDMEGSATDAGYCNDFALCI